MKIYIFTDGASKGNPGPGGWGAVILTPNSVTEIGGGERGTTNNRMELTAAIEAIATTKDLNIDTKDIIIFSDSSYLINGITKWVFGWMRNGWKNTKKEPVLNADLWQRLQFEIEGKSISWKYVPGHSDVAGNERANDIAEEFAFGRDPELFNGQVSEYSIKLIDSGRPLDREGEVSALKKPETKKVKGKKAYSYVSMVNGVIKTHKTWDECRARVEGKTALFKKALSEKDEEVIIKEFKERSK